MQYFIWIYFSYFSLCKIYHTGIWWRFWWFTFDKWLIFVIYI